MTKTSPLFFVSNAAFVVLAVAVGAATWWPTFRSTELIIALAVALVGGILIAYAATTWDFKWWATAAVTIGYYFSGGLFVATPRAVSEGRALEAVNWLVQAPVKGWKDIATLPLPLGSYQATMAPPFLLVLVTTVVALIIATRATRLWAWSVAVLSLIPALGILVGTAFRSYYPEWPFADYLNREVVIGIAFFAVSLAWLLWRSAHIRRQAIAGAYAGASAHGRVRSASTLAMAAASVVVALVAGAWFTSAIGDDKARTVARSEVEAQQRLREATSPAVVYRQSFTDQAYDEVLFRYNIVEGNPERLRLATLPGYDGVQAQPTQAGTDESFMRVPRALSVDSGQRAVVDITIEGWQEVWVPSLDELSDVRFEGERRLTLSDAFFYRAESATAIVASDPALQTGDRFRLTGASYATADLATLGEGSGLRTISADLVPESVSDWIELQQQPRNAAGLVELVQRLRERGFLSHALDAGDDDSLWLQDVANGQFVSSRPGHSSDRIDALFTALIEREAVVGSQLSSQLVAAAGDDEQFAIAAAMIAAELGFPSRVAVGVHLVDTDPLGVANAACEAGECRGKNLSIWTEVQAADGSWVAFDATPQSEVSISPVQSSEREPQFMTRVDRDRVDNVVPPTSQRGGITQELEEEPEEDESSAGLAPAVKIALAVAALVLAILLPFLVIVLWKAMRRRKRSQGSSEARIYGAWDEYVDTALDAGYASPTHHTRRETLELFGQPEAEPLADIADAATFAQAGHMLSADQAEQAWQVSKARGRELSDGFSRFARIRARLSLNSLLRDEYVFHQPSASTRGRAGKVSKVQR